MAAANKLVIVESPTKARTIRQFLGEHYRVEASMGHVRDLPASADEIPEDVKGQPWARLGVDVDHGFAPTYVIPGGKKKVVAELRRMVADADELFLATDEDREGEAIGWHLVEVLKPRVPVRRMVFHEITHDAIAAALAAPRELNTNLVQAQEARRVLDRLVGYVVSPLLWKKVAPRLSAGRVQSSAVRLLVLRERERLAFKSGQYWDVRATVRKGDQAFTAQLVSVAGVRIAGGKDFDEHTGAIPPGKNLLLLQREQAMAVAADLVGKPFTVSALERRTVTRTPAAPFTTSTLQQEANRKLGLSANRTMRIAQRLYEKGHITYMRTDSTSLSSEALGAIRAWVNDKMGADYLSDKPRQFVTKAKGAQEAHEAIRPAGTAMHTAAEIGLSGDESRLYELIWKRAVATQMADAQLAFTTASLQAQTSDGTSHIFRASGREVTFPGFFRAYVEGNDDPTQALDDKSQPLPILVENEQLQGEQTEPLPHETKPPARFTEAALVKALETYGIGRPSTYATIIETIQTRGYVVPKGKQLVPTFTAVAVTQLLETALAHIVDVEFTAGMEARLDQIAGGDNDAIGYLDHFYRTQLLNKVDAGLGLDARAVCALKHTRFAPYEIRIGRYGAFIEYTPTGGGERETVSLPQDIAPADVDLGFIERLLKLAQRSRTPLGQNDAGQNVYVLVGTYGPYVQLGELEPGSKTKPKRVSIPPSIDALSVELDTALQLLALPRTLGPHPDTNKPIKAGIGRYGAYVSHNTIYASLKAEDDILTVDLPRALELLVGKKPRRRASEPVKTLGEHPEGGGVVSVMEGPYGPYVKHGSISASIPEGFAIQDVTMDEAVIWIADKAARVARRSKAPGRKKASAKAAAAPAAAPRTATGKAPSRKKASRKAPRKKATQDS